MLYLLIVLSSDSDTLIHENELTTQAATTKLRATNSGSMTNMRNILSNTLIQSNYTSNIPIRTFGQGFKRFDAIVCDLKDEIKILAFNEEVDCFYDSMNSNKNATIKDGQVKKANELFRTPYSMYEILLLSISEVNVYNVSGFHPSIKLNKKQIRDIAQTIHITNVGKL
ncbi:unnamed protein product [Rotaria magnacalcarata]|uniref:Uncharacterized protein n=1 Tax=Rotaria magnacalcarata TaxID=392030 RepID=A0A8S3CYP4_9BILA|nr:unnamed protein product [Rotaria magnacalcarata]CAF4918173.1 unnamed protein product [Rotaria magnacalcarata]